MLQRIACAILLGTVCAPGQSPDPAFGLSDLPRLKNFEAHRVSSSNRFIPSNDDSQRIMPGETHVMADLPGPGVVTHIWITIADNEFAWPRLLRLRVYYDGRKTPSVDVPLGDFFGIGHGYERDLNSMVIRNSSFGRARNSYWPMPFRESCRITVTDEGNRPVTAFYYHVDWQKRSALPPDSGYFHAYYRQERPAARGRDYDFLNIQGTGQYVGTVLNVIQSQVGWFGEGDDLFFVDGAEHPQILGTGTEDFVNEAWGLRVAFGPWTGTPVAEGERVGARLTGYRWNVPDPIPFQKSIRAAIEHNGWTYEANGALRSGNEERPDFFSSTAFWYQKGVNEGLPELPYGEARLPLGNARQIAVEDSLAEVKAHRGKPSVQREVDWGKDLLFLEAEGPGSRIDIPLDIPDTGRYEIVARIAQAPDYGDYYALLDGKPTNLDVREAATSEVPASGPEVFPGYLPEVLVAIDRPLGWLQLEKGRHTLSFVCVGKDSRSGGYNFGLNDVVLERVPGMVEQPPPPNPVNASATTGPVYRGRPLRDYVRRIAQPAEADRAGVVRAIGAFGADAAPVARDLAGLLADKDASVRTASAWALAQMGAAGAAAVPALENALADANPRLRSLAAIALRSMGAQASAALPGLIKALDDPDAFVRAPAAEALGAMGAAAVPAVDPLTRRLSSAGEQVYVQRSIATALGNIGPAASAAIPALQQALKRPRVSYTAQEALLKIGKQPVPYWW